MGLISAFFIATPSELESIDLNQGLPDTLSSIPTGPMDVVKLITLQCILDGSSYDDHVDDIDAMILKAGSEEGPWIFSVPDVITESLPEKDTRTLEEIGKSWASTEEWTIVGAKEEEIVTLVGWMVKLAKLAISTDRKMYHWLSL